MNEFLELQRKLKEIKKLGWIKCENKYNNAAGITLEKLIGKEIENFPIPDYLNIEIKTRYNNSKSKITLFSAAPDSFLFENKRIVNLYGYPDKQLPQFKVLNTSVSTKTLTYIGNGNNLSLEVDWNNKKIVLNIYKGPLQLIDNLTSWSFDLIEERVNLKLKKLCYINVSRLYHKNNLYIKFENDHYFNIKSTDTFIKLIDDGIIYITFKLGVFKSGKKFGQLHDHGTGFEIEEDNIKLLYNKVL